MLSAVLIAWAKMDGRLAVLLLLNSVPLASAAVHNLFVSNLRGAARIHALEFDDTTNTLTKLQSFHADSTHAWIQFDVRASFDCLFLLPSALFVF